MLAEEYGLHRVVGEEGVLPQRALRLDPSLPVRETELLIQADRLNIDSASFEQMREQAAGDPARITAIIGGIVRSRGKMHNPETGSGGMLSGRVNGVGARHPAAAQLRK